MQITMDALYINVLSFFSFVLRQWFFEEVWTRLQGSLLDSNLSLLLFAFGNRKAATK